MRDCSKIVVMEDLSEGFVDSGILFGPGNPNNWKRNLNNKIAAAYPSTVPTSFKVANQTFLAIANVHAAFWRDKELLKEGYSWLRGSSWIGGNDEASCGPLRALIQTMWESYQRDCNNSDKGIRWDPQVRNIIEKAIKGISWEPHRKRLNENTCFCLVHGDFWPGNIMTHQQMKMTTALEIYDCWIGKWSALEADPKTWDSTSFRMLTQANDESAKNDSFETTTKKSSSNWVFQM